MHASCCAPSRLTPPHPHPLLLQALAAHGPCLQLRQLQLGLQLTAATFDELATSLSGAPRLASLHASGFLAPLTSRGYALGVRGVKVDEGCHYTLRVSLLTGLTQLALVDCNLGRRTGETQRARAVHAGTPVACANACPGVAKSPVEAAAPLLTR